MKIRKAKINQFDIACSLCIAAFIIPDGLSFVSGLSWIETIWRGTMVGVFVFMAFRLLSRTRIRVGVKPYASAFFLAISLCAIYGIFTLINHGSFGYYGEKVIDLIGPLLLIAVFAKKDPSRFLKNAFNVFFFATIVNILGVMWKYPHSFRAAGDYWLFGQKNAMRDILIPALFFSVLRDKHNKKTISLATIFLLITNPIMLFLVQSMTSLVFVIALEMVYIAYLVGMKLGSILKKYMYLYLVLQITIVFVRKIFFSNFITAVLHRNLTFSSRTQIWDCAIDKILESPIIGTGIQTLYNSGLRTSSGTAFSHCHNAILDVLYKGGIFAFFIWALMMVICLKKLESSPNKNLKYLFGMFVGTSIVIGVFADTWSMTNYLMLFMAYNIAYFENLFSYKMPLKQRRKNGDKRYGK